MFKNTSSDLQEPPPPTSRTGRGGNTLVTLTKNPLAGVMLIDDFWIEFYTVWFLCLSERLASPHILFLVNAFHLFKNINNQFEQKGNLAM
jgi:hypothetical protein